jgi:hypothetical protein
MKRIFAVAFIIALAGATEASAACPPNRTIVRTGPNGKTLTLCRDGKYSTCIRDMHRLGWSDQETKRACDRRRDLGRIK